MAGELTCGGTFVFDEMFTSSQIFPKGGTFPSTFTSFSLLKLATILTFKHSSILFPRRGKFSLHISLLFPHSPYSQLATILHFKHNGKIFPTGGKFLRKNFPAGGKFSILTVGNTDKFKYGPEGRGSRDLGSGGGNFILGETITSLGLYLTHYYSR